MRAQLTSRIDIDRAARQHQREQVSWQNEPQLRFLLRKGCKCQIRRLCEMVGLTVTGLKRVHSGCIALVPLPMSQCRYLRRDETF